MELQDGLGAGWTCTTRLHVNWIPGREEPLPQAARRLVCSCGLLRSRRVAMECCTLGSQCMQCVQRTGACGGWRQAVRRCATPKLALVKAFHDLHHFVVSSMMSYDDSLEEHSAPSALCFSSPVPDVFFRPGQLDDLASISQLEVEVWGMHCWPARILPHRRPRRPPLRAHPLLTSRQLAIRQMRLQAESAWSIAFNAVRSAPIHKSPCCFLSLTLLASSPLCSWRPIPHSRSAELLWGRPRNCGLCLRHAHPGRAPDTREHEHARP